MIAWIIVVLLCFALIALVSRKHSMPPRAGSALSEVSQATRLNQQSTAVVASFNIHRCKGRDGKKDLERIAALLQGVDFAGIYEVEGPVFGFKSSQVERLATQLGLQWLFIPTQFQWLHNNRGNGLLSKLPVGAWYAQPLVDSGGRRPRVLFESSVQINDALIDVFLVHMSRHIDQEIQFERICQGFLASERAILMGDLNVTRQFPPLAKLLQDSQACDAIGATQGNADDPDRIDWILTRGLNVLEGEVIDEGASDHPFFSIKVGLPNAAS